MHIEHVHAGVQDGRADRDRLELRLRQPHPVLVVEHAGGVVQRRRRRKHLRRPLEHPWRLSLGVQQRGQPRASPAGIGRHRLAGLAEQRLLVAGVGIGIFGLDRQRTGLEQRIGPSIDRLLLDDEDDFAPHQSFRSASFCSR